MIRKAEKADVLRMAEIFTQDLKETYQGILPEAYLSDLKISEAVKTWQSYLDKERHGCFAAEVDGNLVGFAGYREDEEDASCLVLAALYVETTYQGKGIGKSLIQRVWEYAKSQGYQKVAVCVVEKNQRTRQIYEHMGGTFLERNHLFFWHISSELPQLYMGYEAVAVHSGVHFRKVYQSCCRSFEQPDFLSSAVIFCSGRKGFLWNKNTLWVSEHG